MKIIDAEFTDEEKVARFDQMREFALEAYNADVNAERFKDVENCAFETVMEQTLSKGTDEEFWAHWNSFEGYER